MNPLFLLWGVYVILIGHAMYKDEHAKPTQNYTCEFYCTNDRTHPCIEIKIKDVTEDEANKEMSRVIDNLNEKGLIAKDVTVYASCKEDK